MDEPTIEEWMDRHHVVIVRTHATCLDGTLIGDHLNRPVFLDSLPAGQALTSPQGEALLRPDMSTIIWDGTDPDLGHVICDMTGPAGEPLAFCARSLLRRVAEMTSKGIDLQARFTLQFLLCDASFDELRASKYEQLEARRFDATHSLRAAWPAKAFMNEVIKRFNWQRLPWESWRLGASHGQLEFQLPLTDPVAAADAASLARQIIHEVALDTGTAATFMAQPLAEKSSRTRIDLAFGETSDKRAPVTHEWNDAITSSLPAATALLCPTINSHRMLGVAGLAPPRVTRDSADRWLTQCEQAAADANPYLALVAMLACGLAGREAGKSGESDALPPNPTKADELLRDSDALAQILGTDFIDVWCDARQSAIDEAQADLIARGLDAPKPTHWELEHYIALA